MLTELKGEIDNSNIIFGDFNTPLSVRRVEMNDESMTYQNLWDASKAVLRNLQL